MQLEIYFVQMFIRSQLSASYVKNPTVQILKTLAMYNVHGTFEKPCVKCVIHTYRNKVMSKILSRMYLLSFVVCKMVKKKTAEFQEPCKPKEHKKCGEQK